MAINDDIQAAIDGFDMDWARSLLRDALKDNPDAQTYYLAALAAISDSQRVGFLKKAVELDPFHAEAVKELERVENSSAPKPAPPVAPPEQVTQTAAPLKFKAPAFVEAAPAAPPSPAPHAVESAPTLSDFVTGTVTGSASTVGLYTIPFVADDNRRTTIPVGAEVVLVRRTEKLDWFNVLYFATTGNEILGWIEANNLSNINYLGKPVIITDLPVSQFEWNSRDDISKLIEQHKKQLLSNPQSLSDYLTTVFLAVGIVGGPVLALVSLQNGAGVASLGIAVLAAGVSIGCLIYGISRERTKNTRIQPTESSKYEEVAEEIRRLQSVHKAMKPASQQAFEDDLKRSAINAALQIGVNAATRLVPDRKNISIR